MQDIIDPVVHLKINKFLQRKAREFPELDLNRSSRHAID